MRPPCPQEMVGQILSLCPRRNWRSAVILSRLCQQFKRCWYSTPCSSRTVVSNSNGSKAKKTKICFHCNTVVLAVPYTNCHALFKKKIRFGRFPLLSWKIARSQVLDTPSTSETEPSKGMGTTATVDYTFSRPQVWGPDMGTGTREHRPSSITHAHTHTHTVDFLEVNCNDDVVVHAW